MGVNVPAYVALSEGPARKAIGHRQDFLNVKTGMQAQHRRLQGAVAFCRGGHGRAKKTKALERFSRKEMNWRNTMNHNFAKAIVDFAFIQRAGTIKMEMLGGFGVDDLGRVEEQRKWLLRNWGWSGTQAAVVQKAEKFGASSLFRMGNRRGTGWDIRTQPERNAGWGTRVAAGQPG